MIELKMPPNYIHEITYIKSEDNFPISLTYNVHQPERLLSKLIHIRTRIGIGYVSLRQF
jgi:hypothetical protein